MALSKILTITLVKWTSFNKTVVLLASKCDIIFPPLSSIIRLTCSIASSIICWISLESFEISSSFFSNFDILRTDTNTVFTDAINTTTPPTIEDVQTELDKLEDANYTAYKALNGTQKLAAVQEFISAFPTNKDGDYTGYTTVSAYFAAVDAAIAK